MNFRHDINGLRAVAVLAVVLFHFNPQWLPGGFAGVDVFFVISGFLMTSIIFNGIEKNTFSLFKFYNARANRIIPVLAAMSLTVIIFGVFYLLPGDLENIGKQIQKSSIFTSNILFSEGGGYFDTSEHTKWLLHTWSLSVEWQFYIFFPIIIIALKKYLSFANLKRIVVGLFIASFIYCIYATYKDSKTAYFMLTSRAWEMLLGGLAFLYPLSFKNKSFQLTAQYSGLLLILASYFFISKDTPWPGYMALIPVFGAYLIIISNQQGNVLLNNPIMSNIGKWSYSIYVWHWPLVVFGFYFAIENWYMFGIPLSIFLGSLSYKLIEQINFQRYSSWSDIYKVKPLYMFLLIFALSTVVRKTHGLMFIYPKNVTEILLESKNVNPYICDSGHRNSDFEECKIGNQNNIKAIIIGDSHADAITTALATSFDLNSEGIISITTSGTAFLFNTKISSKDIKDSGLFMKLNNQRMKWLLDNRVKYHNTPLILTGRWVDYVLGENDPERMKDMKYPPLYSEENPNAALINIFARGLENSIHPIHAYYQIYIMQPIPEIGRNVPKTMAKELYLDLPKSPDISYQDYLERSGEVRSVITATAKKYGVKTLDPAAYLCGSGHCISEYKGRPIYRDGDHLSEYGNKILVPMFKHALNP